MTDSINILQEMKLCYDMIEIIKHEPINDLNNDLLINLNKRIYFIKKSIRYSEKSGFNKNLII